MLSLVFYAKEINTLEGPLLEHVENMEPKQNDSLLNDERKIEKLNESITNQTSTDKETILIVDDDMSLGGIYLGSTIQEVFEIHGRTNGYRDPNDGMYFRYQYDDLDVVFVRNRVVRIATRTDKIQTREGLRQGDMLDRVIQIYGNDYEKIVRDDEILYVYNFLSPNQVSYQLHFLCKDDIVCCIAVEGLIEYLAHSRDITVQRL